MRRTMPSSRDKSISKFQHRIAGRETNSVARWPYRGNATACAFSFSPHQINDRTLDAVNHRVTEIRPGAELFKKGRSRSFVQFACAARPPFVPPRALFTRNLDQSERNIRHE